VTAVPEPLTFRMLTGRVIDGDTLAGRLQTEPLRLTPGWSTVATSDLEVHLRLVTLDTPERGEDGWAKARSDVMLWLAQWPVVALRVDTYGDGGFGRLLADVYPVGRRSETLSQHMLQLGWLPWVP